jgi:hypothetical protein
MSPFRTCSHLACPRHPSWKEHKIHQEDILKFFDHEFWPTIAFDKQFCGWISEPEMIEIHCLDGELLVSNESHPSSIIISSLDMGAKSGGNIKC